MKNIIDKLLKLDAGKLEIESKECKVDKLSEVLKEDALLTCYPVSVDVYSDIQNKAIELDKKGNLKGINTGKMNMELVINGVLEIKNKELLAHFNAATPAELLRNQKLFKAGDISKLAQTVSELSGITVVEKGEEEIKNS
jgi:hypothetical protein